MDQNFTTPMMKQYQEIKKQYQDCLLFFRMGDFYELFMEDAFTGARVLNITLTSRAKGKDGRIPMAGVPYHAVDSYLTKLVKAGYKVAICEQVSEPNKYGIVDREVIRVVTPGTVFDENALNQKENNYIVALSIKDDKLAFTIADVSTGYFSTQEIEFNNLESTILNEFTKIKPIECILPDDLYNDHEILRVLKSTSNFINIYPFQDWDKYSSNASSYLKKRLKVATLESFGVDKLELALETSAALLAYLEYTQKTNLTHIKKITLLNSADSLILDRSSMINLELFSTIREHDTRGSLHAILDQTKTSMGGRLLKQWIAQPLVKKEEIEKRYDAIEEIINDQKVKEQLEVKLESLHDIERILSRLSVKIGNARDLVNLKNALIITLELKQSLISYPSSEAQAKSRSLQKTSSRLRSNNSGLLEQLYKQISPKIQDVIDLIEQHIVDEPPIDLRSGGLIKNGINQKLDKLRSRVSKSKDWVVTLETQERERTGISSLKVRFNKVFGFYIEISKANLHLAPDNYYRKQTLVNGERFITPELKEQEEIILTSEETINELEYEIFEEVLLQVLDRTQILQEAAEALATLDCIVNFAHLAIKNQYIRPKLLYSGEIRIKGGRHPVVEKLLTDKQFVPNDVALDNISQSLWLITGPNMAGKSVFIRQVALIVLMAQMGCFVPAESAHISIVDRIFVRSGASDVITSNMSTFMVEMVETAHILHHATKNSLIVMDEIGRGTSTYDGISIAWAVAEYLVKNFKSSPKTLFATHYHELQTLEEQFPNQIRNYHMAVADEKGEPIFLHTILPGGASHSFGVAVAKLAGVPDKVIKRAQEILKSLENREHPKSNFYSSSERNESRSYNNLVLDDAPPSIGKYSRGARTINIADRLIHKELENLDISQMTPLQALNKLADLKDKVKLSQKEERVLEVD